MGSVHGDIEVEPIPSSCLYKFCCKAQCTTECLIYPWSPVKRIREHVHLRILKGLANQWCIVDISRKPDRVVDGTLLPSGTYTTFDRCIPWEAEDAKKADDYYRHTRKGE